MLCEKCHKREAKIYYTEIINGEKKEQYLCEECASACTSFQLEKAGTDLDLGGLLSSILSTYYGEKKEEAQTKEKTILCPTCGISYEEVLNTGKLGCADCYHTFQEVIERTLRQIQGADTHIGKAPGASIAGSELFEANKETEHKKEETKEEKINRLSLQLNNAVKEEEFETAAHLRDEIKELKKEVGKDG
jgi:protein arginine kinase activator